MKKNGTNLTRGVSVCLALLTSNYWQDEKLIEGTAVFLKFGAISRRNFVLFFLMPPSKEKSLL